MLLQKLSQFQETNTTHLEVTSNFNVDIENMTIAVIMFVSERNEIKLNVQKIEEFMHRVFPNDKDYQMSKTSIERRYKKISEKYDDADIEGLKVSNKAVKTLCML